MTRIRRIITDFIPYIGDTLPEPEFRKYPPELFYSDQRNQFYSQNLRSINAGTRMTRIKRIITDFLPSIGDTLPEPEFRKYPPELFYSDQRNQFYSQNLRSINAGTRIKRIITDFLPSIGDTLPVPEFRKYQNSI